MAERLPEKSLFQEIAELERLLQEKKQALAQEGEAVPEHEIFRETFRERYGEALSPMAPAMQPPPVLPQDELTRHTEELKVKEREAQLEALLGVAFTKGVPAAAEVARHATPWLLDELHDRLQDRYYEHLIQMGKLKPL